VSVTEVTQLPTVRKGRGVELALTIIALLIGVGAYAIVGLAHDGILPAGMFGYGAGLAFLAGVAHIVIRLRAPYADPLLLPIVVLLNSVGLAMIHRLDLALIDRAAERGNEPPSLGAPNQLTWTAVGVLLFVATLFVVRDHRTLQRYTYTAGFVGLGLLMLPLVPGLGVVLNGSRIWIRLLGFSFQPGEAAKIALIIAFAGYLVVTRDALALAGRRVLGIDLPRARDLGPILVTWLASLGLLVFERDLGTSLLFFGIFVVMLYVATERASWLIVGALLFFGGAFIAFRLFAHVQLRIDAWLDPFSDVDRFGQIVQSLYGLAYGGILGTGLGEGRPQLVPYARSDFIIAAFGEELGLTGLMAIILCYGFIVERGLRTALLVRDQFGKLLATGLATSFALQVFIVIGGVTKLIPLTGLTTPFLSLGGSSLVVNWAIIALLLRMSDAARRPAPPPAPPIDEAYTQVVRT
jgi:cell division protein FtsW (lipid II flippase)